jgi:DNA ligase-associated metallophosphoesterase
LNIVKEHITEKEESLILTNQRAIFWEGKNALILSDLHVGKAAHFRKHGIPIPDEVFKNDLDRLEGLIRYFKAEQLIVVGDLFHAEANTNMQYFVNWKRQFQSLEMTLVKGNHDRLSEFWTSKLQLKMVSRLEMKPYLLLHDPDEEHTHSFTIAGHIHPGVLIKGKGRQKYKMPCYILYNRGLILPAFSNFTGLNSRFKRKDAVYYAFTESEFFRF